MNCLDCARVGDSETAVAVCGRCGAGLCVDHLREGREWLTVTAPINRRVTVEPPTRRLRCEECEMAEMAQAAGSHGRSEVAFAADAPRPTGTR